MMRIRIPLFARSPGGYLHVFEPDHAFEPGEGWTVIGLVPGNDARAAAEKTRPGREHTTAATGPGVRKS